jgi:hypothetical protein
VFGSVPVKELSEISTIFKLVSENIDEGIVPFKEFPLR